MSLDSMRVYVESTYQAAMQASHPSVPVRFDNINFQQPQTAWADLCILSGKSFAANLGSKVVDRHVGIVQVNILVPQRSGEKLANDLAEFSGQVFRRKNQILSDGAVARFRIPEFARSGQSLGFYSVIVRIPYWRDERPQ